jgi:hypothetical protein
MITDLAPLPLVPEHSPHLLQLDLNPISADAGQLMNCAMGVGDATNERYPMSEAIRSSSSV